MQTVKELAAELGVTPQTIRNVINRKSITTKQNKDGRGFCVSDDDAALIKSAVNDQRKKSAQNKGTAKQKENDTLLLLLQNELEAKNKQIEALQQENAKLTDSLAKTTESLQAAQALHAATVQQLLEQKENRQEVNKSTSNESEPEPGSKKRWWEFWK